MDVLGVNKVMNSKKQQAKRSCKKPLKVVYISTPMKVQTSASNFRDLVQELTGRDSDTARFMELYINGGCGDDHHHHDHEQPRNNYYSLPDDHHHQRQQSLRTSPDDHDEEEAHKFPLLMSTYTELLQPYSSEANYSLFN